MDSSDSDEKPVDSGSKDPVQTSSEDSATEEEVAPQSMITIEEEADAIVKRAKYIPLRLTDKERELLNILSGALEISE